MTRITVSLLPLSSATAATSRIPLDSNSTNAFISAILVMLSKLNGRNTANFKIDMGTWTPMASQFMTVFGLSRSATKIFNVYNLKGNIPETMALELGMALLEKRLAIERNNSVSREQFLLLKDIDLQLRKKSFSAWNRIHSKVTYLNNPKLTSAFPLEDDAEVAPEKAVLSSTDIKKVASALQPIIKSLTNRNNFYLTIDEAKALKENNPELSVTYGALIKRVKATVKRLTFNYVRSQSARMVGIDELKSFLAKEGVPNNLPTGFIGGKIDDMGKCYTAEDRPLDAVPLGVVRMNAKYDPALDNTYVMSGVDHRRRYRTTTFTGSNTVKRFSKVNIFIAEELTHRAAWLKGLNEAGRTPILSAMVELIYQTSSRIGGVGNETAGEPTYGMSTLQVRHLSLTPKLITYDYTGKKLAQQGAQFPVKDATSKKILAILTELVKDKAPTASVFTYKNKPVTGPAVNRYLKNLNVDLSIHRFRQVAGTKMAKRILKSSPFKASANPKQAVVESWVKEAMKEVGTLLHHTTGEKLTGMTALKSYIDPAAILDFFEVLGLRKPSFIK